MSSGEDSSLVSCSESVSFIWSMSISLDIASLSALLDRIFVLPFFGGLMYTVCRSDTRFLTFVHVCGVCVSYRYAR